jgi:P4 family phage/plasmid primase-like protien
MAKESNPMVTTAKTAAVKNNDYQPCAQKIKPNGRNPLIQIVNAGRAKFSEFDTYRLFEAAAPLFLTQGEDWYQYDGKAWRLSARERFARLVYDQLPPELHKHHHVKATLNQAEAKHQMGEKRFIGATRFGEDGAVLLNIANGVLRVTSESVELLPHDKDYLFRACMPSHWHGPQKSMDYFSAALSQILPDPKDRILLQWFAGYCLFPDCKQHEQYLICYGKGGTGKSTLAQAIVNAFDDGTTVTHLSLRQICGSGADSYSLPSLEHAVVNLGTELDTLEMDESNNLKQIVSGEKIITRSIYGKPFDMTTTCKLWFLSNVMPRFKAGTDAEYRRTKFIVFSHKPDVPDLELKDRLLEERDAIFAWCVNGLQAILQGFPMPQGSAESRAALTSFKLSNDPLGCFIEERCILSAECEVAKDVFVAELYGFVEAYGFSLKARDALFKTLYERYPKVRPVRHRTRSPEMYISGIGLRD